MFWISKWLTLNNSYWVQLHASLPCTTVFKKSEILNDIETSWAVCTKIKSAPTSNNGPLNINLIYFRALLFEMQCPKNFGDIKAYIHTDKQTDKQKFYKNGKILFKTPENMQIHRNPAVENFLESNRFFFSM